MEQKGSLLIVIFVAICHLEETWEIWVHVEGKKKPGAIHLANIATVDALCEGIKAKFKNKFGECDSEFPMHPCPPTLTPRS